MDFEQAMGTAYMAIDAIKRGDIDEAEIERHWVNDDDLEEGFRVVLRRDVLGRNESKKLDEALKALGDD